MSMSKLHKRISKEQVDLSNSKFSIIEPEQMFCILCKCLIIDAQFCTECDCYACALCLEEYKESSKSSNCPNGEHKMDFMKVDTVTLNAIKKLSIKCLQGCNKLVTLETMEEHLEQCEAKEKGKKGEGREVKVVEEEKEKAPKQQIGSTRATVAGRPSPPQVKLAATSMQNRPVLPFLADVNPANACPKCKGPKSDKHECILYLGSVIPKMDTYYQVLLGDKEREIDLLAKQKDELMKIYQNTIQNLVKERDYLQRTLTMTLQVSMKGSEKAAVYSCISNMGILLLNEDLEVKYNLLGDNSPYTVNYQIVLTDGSLATLVNNKNVIIWDTMTYKMRKVFPPELKENPENWQFIFEEGSLMGCCGKETISYWRWETGEFIKAVSIPQNMGVLRSLLPDSNLVFAQVTPTLTTIHVWNYATGEFLATFNYYSNHFPQNILFLNKDNIAFNFQSDNFNRLVVYNISSKESKEYFELKSTDFYMLKLSNGVIFTSSYAPKYMWNYWNLELGMCEKLVTGKAHIVSLVQVGSGNALACARVKSDYRLILLNLYSGVVIQTAKFPATNVINLKPQPTAK